MLIFILLIVVGLILFVAKSYNGLQKLAQNVREGASNMQVAISRKLALVNQLIDLVKNYQASEQLVQLKVSQDNTAAAMATAYQQTGSVLSSIQGMAERFPNLKSNEQYNRLGESIKECEAHIEHSRNHYNAAVKAYNTERLKIPVVFIARYLGFGEAPYLQFDQSGATDPNALREFKTDDGERLQQLLSGAGSSIAKTTRILADHAGQAGKLLADRIKEEKNPKYFYMVEGGTPKGPSTLNEIRQMQATGHLAGPIMVSLQGSDHWVPLAGMASAHTDAQADHEVEA